MVRLCSVTQNPDSDIIKQINMNIFIGHKSSILHRRSTSESRRTSRTSAREANMQALGVETVVVRVFSHCLTKHGN